MIELRDETEVVAFWIVSGPECDLLACLARQPGEGWKIQFRFRYYIDDKAFDSKDEKAWYESSVPDGEVDDAERRVDEVARELSEAWPGEVEKIDVHGKGPKAFELLSKSKSMHLRLEHREPEPA